MPSLRKSSSRLALKDISDIIADVKASRCFGKSSRQLRLFEHLLEKSLAGKSDELSQYSIALDVLERSENFDPITDSIVRVELHRLRANLKIYKNYDGAYEICIPSGSFEVDVTRIKKGVLKNWSIGRLMPAGALTLLAVVVGAAIFIPKLSSGGNKIACSTVKPNVKITYTGEPSEAESYVDTILRSTISQHTGFNLLGSGYECEAKAGPTLDLQYSIVQENSQINVALNVLDDETQSVVKSKHVSGKLSNKQEHSSLYFQLVETANSLALQRGVLARYAYEASWSSEGSRESYGCLIAMYDSFAGQRNSKFNDIHDCLENSVKSGLGSLDNYGALAASYLDTYKNKRGESGDDSLIAAENILDEHGRMWSESVELTIAELYKYFNPEEFELEQLENRLEVIQTRYNTNPIILLMISYVRGYTLGQWPEAKAISDHIKKIYAIRDQSIYGVDAAYALINGVSPEDMRICFKHYSEESIYATILVNACAISAGNQFWIQKTEKNLKRLKMFNLQNRLGYMDENVHNYELLAKITSLIQPDIVD